MRAFVLHDLARPAELQDVPAPQPARQQVLIAVRAASVNPFDAAVASGMLKDMMEHRLPVTIGRDFAGVVERTGEDAQGFDPGDELLGLIPPAPYLQVGTFAEYVAYEPAPFLTRKPASLDFANAASLGLAATTAEVCARAVAPEAGHVVLIVGAGGGVGGYATQLAAARGATVIATCRAADAERVRGLGASDTIDYTQGVAAQLVERFPDGVDALIDAADRDPAAFTAIAAHVKPGGRIASTMGVADADAAGQRGVTATNVNGLSDPSAFQYVVDAAAAGRLRPLLARALPLAQAAEAIAAVAGGGVGGKVVVKISE